jgi:hypothetical protein
LVSPSEPQIQLVGGSFLAKNLSYDFKSKFIHVEALRLCIVRANDGDVVNALEHFELDPTSTMARLQGLFLAGKPTWQVDGSVT